MERRLAALQAHLGPAGAPTVQASSGVTMSARHSSWLTETITGVELGILKGTRPRSAGKNARLDVHGTDVTVPIVRLTTGSSVTGFGRQRVPGAKLEAVLGMTVGAAMKVLSTSAEQVQSGHTTTGLSAAVGAIEYALLDLVGKLRSMPVRQFAAEAAESDAAALIASEATEGYGRGHRAFKIKTGRGARWLELEEGITRDIAVIKAVREAVGPDCLIMIDANNGYNLAITKRVLAETRDVGIYWVEEAFHEDSVLYDDLRQWLAVEGIDCLIADGEGAAHPGLVAMATDGPLDVVQYDIFSYGFMAWVVLGSTVDAAGVMSAPHHYGGALGNYYSGHLTGAIEGFARVEWDEVVTPGIDASAYTVEGGYVSIPDAPGFGLVLDESIFKAAVETETGQSHGKPCYAP